MQVKGDKVKRGLSLDEKEGRPEQKFYKEGRNIERWEEGAEAGRTWQQILLCAYKQVVMILFLRDR